MTTTKLRPVLNLKHMLHWRKLRVGRLLGWFPAATEDWSGGDVLQERIEALVHAEVPEELFEHSCEEVV